VNKSNICKFIATSTASVVAVSTAAPVASHAEAGKAFKDISEGHTFYNEIMDLFEQGAISGFQDGTFRPNDVVTRSQAAKMIADLLKLDTKNVKDPGLKDIKKHKWYYGAVAALVQNQIVTGFKDGTFRPDQTLTRAEAARMIVEAFKLKNKGEKLVNFKDVKEGNWYYQYVQNLVNNGVTYGKSKNLFAPQDKVTRGEMAAFMSRAQKAMVYTVKEISGQTINLSGKVYKIGKEVQPLLNEKNKAALKDAEVKVLINGDTVTELLYLEIHSSGEAAVNGQEEFSNNVVLDGQNATIKGNLFVKGNYVTLKNLKIEGSLFIEEELKNDFYAQNVTVSGDTIVNGGDDNTVVFEQSTLKVTKVNKKDVHVKFKQNSAVSKVIISVKAAVSADSTVTLPIVELTEGASSVTLDARITNLLIPSGKTVNNLVVNYDAVKHKIDKINGNSNATPTPSTPPSTGGGGGATPTPTPTPTPDPAVKVTNVTYSQDTVVKGSNEDSISLFASVEKQEGDTLTVELWKGNEKVGELLDNGNLDNADDILNDGVYSMKYDLGSLNPGTYTFKVIAKLNGKVAGESEPFTLSVIEPLTIEQSQQINTLAETAAGKAEELLQGNKTIETVVNELKQESGIIQAAASSSDDIWYATDYGVLGGVIVPTTSVQTSAVKSVAMKKTVKVTSVEESIGNNKVLILSPASENETNSLSSIENALKETNKFVVDSKSGTVEDFKQVAGYGMVIMHSHGGLMYGENLKANAKLAGLDEEFSLANEKAVFMTSEEATPEKNIEYQSDLKKGRLTIVNGYYAITPAFVKHYWENMANTLFINSSAKSLDDSFSKVVLNNGAKTYVGFKDDNADVTIVEAFVNQLISGESTGTAYNKLTNQGSFALSGSTNLSILLKGISNGNFETGNTLGWHGNGDVRVISQLGTDGEKGKSVMPKEGKYMAIISTGLGSLNDDSNSWIERTFVVPEDATALKFDYNVVSEEPLEFVGTVFDDQFKASITYDGAEKIIAEESVNKSKWTDTVNVDFFGGDETAYETGWKRVVYDVSDLQGKTITLKFHTWDEGDSIYDTAALLDNVQFTDSTYTSLQLTGPDLLSTGKHTSIKAVFKDQYGDVWTSESEEVEWSLENPVEGVSISESGELTIEQSVAVGTEIVVQVKAGELTAKKTVKVAEKSFLTNSQIKVETNGDKGETTVTVSDVTPGEIIKIYSSMESDTPLYEFTAESETLTFNLPYFYDLYFTSTKPGKVESDKVVVFNGEINEPAIMFEATVPVEPVTANEEFEMSIRAFNLHEDYESENAKLRYKINLVKLDESGTAIPVADQMIKYNEPGQTDFSSSFNTDSNGIAYFGPEQGLPAEVIEQLKTEQGVTSVFRTSLAETGVYWLTISLLDVTEEEQIIGEYGTQLQVN
jgi:hypothetical protein